MAVDLSKSVFESLQRSLKRARQLAEEGQYAAAADAYEGCVGLANRYAGYALTPSEKARRVKLAQEYGQLAAGLRARPAKEAAAATAAAARPPQTERDADADEYRAAAAALIEKAAVAWDDIAGLTEVKNQIRVSYGFAMASRPEGVRLNTGRNILFFGPPGTGKTLLAAAASRELDATFFNVKVSNVLSKYFGESTKLVEALFSVARDRAPSVVFFDEFDALTARRDSADSGGPERRLLATLLGELDGLAQKADAPFVLTLAATNLPWMIDSAVLSRFDRRVYVPLPDETVRRGILEIHIARQGYSLAGGMEAVVARTKGLSGRRIAQLCESAVRAMVMEQNPDLLSRVDRGRQAVESYRLKLRPLTQGDFDRALAGASPEVDRAGVARYEQWRQANA